MNFESPLTDLKGIGEKTAQKFQAAGISCLGDLIGYFPRTYDTFLPPGRIADAADGQILAVCGAVMRTLSVRYAGRFQITSGTIQTEEETIPVTWFNMPYLRGHIEPGRRYVFRGYVKQKGKRTVLTQPAVYDSADYEEKCRQLQPVYPLTKGLKESTLRGAIRKALEGLDLTAEFLPEEIRREYELASSHFAYWQIHFPNDLHDCVIARNRLVFDEFLLFILALKQLKERRLLLPASVPIRDMSYVQAAVRELPYELTAAQEKVWRQIREDMGQNKAMTRLIQGDVGCGKTIIAFLAMLGAAAEGLQSALMVPTEVLARQHAAAFRSLTEAAGIPVKSVLLTGSLSAKEKRETLASVKSGEASVIIGTHALIQEPVVFSRLGLVITDEQHRFGVKQREALSSKGQSPHILVMSATPIPRTLAVILYGDLDVSVIDQLPADRKSVKNCVVDPSWHPKAYAFIEKEIRAGRQAYVICPMVEESELIDAENVIDYTEKLRHALGERTQVEYLHGKMKAARKNEIMERFAAGEIQVLVSTTVIEVGVNVPNATVMMIEDAQRFGLSQLHQLRGRVGRGTETSYCIMIDSSGNEEENARLKIMNSTNDGFEIARKDLELRGPGDLFGIRQSGLIDFKIADVFQDAAIMQKASEAAGRILSEDHDLSMRKHRGLRQKLLSYMQKDIENVNI